jgi:hypothetical protein
MNFFKKLFGSSTKTEVPAPTPNAAESPEPDAANHAARLTTAECLDRHWQSVGTVEKDVRTGGRAAREDLVARLQAAGVGHVRGVYRESVV